MDPIKLYDDAYLGIFDGTIDWEQDDIIAILLTSDYTFDAGGHTDYYDVQLLETEDDDYAPQIVPYRQIQHVDDEIRYTSDQVRWGVEEEEYKVSISAKYLVLVRREGAELDPSDKLIGCVDFGDPPATSTNADFAYTPSETGWFRIQKAL